MALYVVIAPGKGDRLQATLSERFPDDFYRVGSESFVVYAKGLTTKQVSEKLDITNDGPAPGPNANAVVLAAKGAYWGLYNVSLWEWMKVKLEAPNA